VTVGFRFRFSDGDGSARSAAKRLDIADKYRDKGYRGIAQIW